MPNTFQQFPLNQSCLLTLVEHYHLLRVATLPDALAGDPPRLSESQALNLDACARVSLADVTDSLDLIGELIGHYSEDAGGEEQLFPKLGSTLRLLSGVLVLADQMGESATDALGYYARGRSLPS